MKLIWRCEECGDDKRKERVDSPKLKCNRLPQPDLRFDQVQSNLSTTDTEETEQSVRIKQVSV